MTAHNPPEVEIVARSSTENGCKVTSIIYDPADAQLILYGTVTRDGVLVGSYYCADRVRQRDWRIVAADGHELTLDRRHSGAAVRRGIRCHRADHHPHRPQARVRPTPPGRNPPTPVTSNKSSHALGH